MPVGSIIPYANNAKQHPEDQVNDLASQIAKFGWDQPIVVDQKNVIIKGHGRLLAAKKLNLKEVPVVYSSLDEYEAMASRIADNKVATKGLIDQDRLKFDVNTLNLKNFDLKFTGMSDLELKPLIESDSISKQIFGNKDQQDQEEDEGEEATLDTSSDEEADEEEGDDMFMDRKPIISYSIIFDDEDQQKVWNDFIKSLKEKYSDCETIAERLILYIQEHE